MRTCTQWHQTIISLVDEVAPKHHTAGWQKPCGVKRPVVAMRVLSTCS
jgi:hypothetical protein